jgi:hypothetical protein
MMTEEGPMPKLSPAELGWAAAVVDLKGKVYRKKNRQRATPQLVLHVQSKDRRVVHRLSQMTETKPEMLDIRSIPDFMRHPCNEHCPEAHIHVKKGDMPQIGTWTVTGAAMVIVLHNLKPYMTTWYGWDDVYHECLSRIVTSGQGVGMVRQSAHRLEELGWKIPPELGKKLWPDEVARRESLASYRDRLHKTARPGPAKKRGGAGLPVAVGA